MSNTIFLPFQILIPFILVTCTLRAVHVITRVPIRALFLLIFLMSDAMALVRSTFALYELMLYIPFNNFFRHGGIFLGLNQN